MLHPLRSVPNSRRNSSRKLSENRNQTEKTWILKIECWIFSCFRNSISESRQYSAAFEIQFLKAGSNDYFPFSVMHFENVHRSTIKSTHYESNTQYPTRNVQCSSQEKIRRSKLSVRCSSFPVLGHPHAKKGNAECWIKKTRLRKGG